MLKICLHGDLILWCFVYLTQTHTPLPSCRSLVQLSSIEVRQMDFKLFQQPHRQPLQLHCYAHVPDQGQDLKIASKIHLVQTIPYQIVHIHLGYFVVNSLYHNNE